MALDHQSFPSHLLYGVVVAAAHKNCIFLKDRTNRRVAISLNGAKVEAPKVPFPPNGILFPFHFVFIDSYTQSTHTHREAKRKGRKATIEKLLSLTFPVYINYVEHTNF